MLPWTQDKREVLRWYHEYKSRQRCEVCGGTIKIQFHHREPTVKRFNISNMVIKGMSVARIKEEIAKCAPLCERCHKLVHKDEKLLLRSGRNNNKYGKRGAYKNGNNHTT